VQPELLRHQFEGFAVGDGDVALREAFPERPGHRLGVVNRTHERQAASASRAMLRRRARG